MTDDELAEYARRAIDGEREALEALVRRIQDPIYGLALRMLGNLEDAHDASQEALIRVVTRLGTFRGDSRFTTWVYRIAANTITDLLRKRARRLDFEQLAAQLGQPAPDASEPPRADASVLAKEVYLGCALGLLACLDDDQRLAFVLGEVMELDHAEASAVQAISEAAHRKRLSRARAALRAFLQPRCSIVNSDAPCRCAHQVPLNLALGRLRPDALRLAPHPCSAGAELLLDPKIRARALAAVDGVEKLLDALELLRHQPDYLAPQTLRRSISDVLASGSS
ncbi:MAG: RNA polymerase sigma factor [Polyangiaceae bacterium]